MILWKCSALTIMGMRRAMLGRTYRSFSKCCYTIPLQNAHLAMDGSRYRELLNRLHGLESAVRVHACGPEPYCSLNPSRMISTCPCKRNRDKTDDPPSPTSFDVKNDPEMKAVLNEITEDFEGKSPVRKIEYDESSNETSVQLPKEMRGKFMIYEEKDAEVILDIDEELQQIGDEEEDDLRDKVTVVDEPFRGLNLQRGVSGVYELDDLVQVLDGENAADICVIQVPKELAYADYLVLANARSQRHLMAMAEFINKLYKRKKAERDDFIIIQGENSKSWMALDMGNIVLHLFMPQERHKYDIETLWSVGEKYDDQSQRTPTDSTMDKLKSQLKYLDEIKPIEGGVA